MEFVTLVDGVSEKDGEVVIDMERSPNPSQAPSIHVPEEEVKAPRPDSGVGNLIANFGRPTLEVALTWQNLKYSIIKGRGKRKKTTVVLEHVHGMASPGEISAILGPSGAGKTTLLNLLAGRVETGRVEGTINVNGQKRDELFGSVAAYVEQDDVMMATLTVQETLRFAAHLRLPKSMPVEEKYKRVDETIAALGLNKVKNNRIGDVAKRGVSGGERKRTSIGIELLTNPGLLFLDEPTSGLDSFNAFNLVELLGRLASSGRTVIMTIHQPRANIFDLFDKVTFLSQGRIVYMGSPTNVIPYFSELGYPCPTYTNPADFVLDVVTLDSRSPDLLEESEKRVNLFRDNYLKVFEESAKENVRHEEERRRTLASGINRPKIRKYQAAWGREVRVIFHRNWLNFVRDKKVTLVQCVQTLLVAIIVGLIFFGAKLDQKGVQNRLGSIFFVLLNLSFSNVLPKLNTFPAEFAIFRRERASNTYRVAPYAAARTLIDLFSVIVLPIFFLAIIYFMIGFQAKAANFFTMLVIIWAAALCAQSFGVAVSAVAGNATVAQVLSLLFLLLFALFGGFYSNSGSYLAGISWIQYLSFVNYSFKALMQNEFTGLTFSCGTTPGCSFPTGAEVIAFYGAGSPTIWVDFVIVMAMTVFYKLVNYTALKLRTRPRRQLCPVGEKKE